MVAIFAFIKQILQKKGKGGNYKSYLCLGSHWKDPIYPSTAYFTQIKIINISCRIMYITCLKYKLDITLGPIAFFFHNSSSSSSSSNNNNNKLITGRWEEKYTSDWYRGRKIQ